MNIGVTELFLLLFSFGAPVLGIVAGYFVIKLAVKNAIKELKRDNQL